MTAHMIKKRLIILSGVFVANYIDEFYIRSIFN